MLSAIAAATLAVLALTTQNVRQGLPPDQARHDIHQAAARSSVVVTQEMGRRQASHFAPGGWGTAHFRGLRRGDCATYWQRSSWRIVGHPQLRQLTYAPFRAGHRFALATVLRGHGTRVAVVCVHLITRWLDRRAVYAAGMRRLGHWLTQLRQRWPHVVVGGDWNRPWDRRASFAGFTSEPPSKATGPLGGRIDYLDWHQASWRSSQVVGHTFSDHQGFRVRLVLP